MGGMRARRERMEEDGGVATSSMPCMHCASMQSSLYPEGKALQLEVRS